MERRQSDREYRDLLVRLDEKVTNLTQEFKDFKENLGGRIEELEKKKVSFNDINALRDAFSTSSNDHENRIRSVEGKINYWAGGLVVAEFVIGYVIYYLLK